MACLSLSSRRWIAATWAIQSLIWGVACRAQGPQNYGQYYQQHARVQPNVGTSRYLYDRYFYQNSAVSPYMSLSRPGTGAATGYQAFVAPELQRRDSEQAARTQYVQQRKAQGDVGRTDYRAALGRTYNVGTLPQTHRSGPPATNPYFQRYYGNLPGASR